MDQTLLYYVIGGLGLVVALFYEFIWKGTRRPRHGKHLEAEDQPITEAISGVEIIDEPELVRLYDSTLRIVDDVDLDGTIIHQIKDTCGGLGRKWNKDGKWLYLINKYADGKEIRYRPAEFLMTSTRDMPPSKVHSALTQPEVAIAFNVQESKNWLQKYGMLLLFIFGCLFVMYMWSQS